MGRTRRTKTSLPTDTIDAISRIAIVRAKGEMSASEAMIAQSTVVVCSVFGAGRFAPETVPLRRHLLERCGLTLEEVSASQAAAAAAHDRAFAPRPPKVRRRRRHLELVA